MQEEHLQQNGKPTHDISFISTSDAEGFKYLFNLFAKMTNGITAAHVDLPAIKKMINTQSLIFASEKKMKWIHD